MKALYLGLPIEVQLEGAGDVDCLPGYVCQAGVEW